ncbi:Uncharacterized membrane protein [Parapedobacter composti]|uniref:Uncharacterized membrane protein n=1 Tax=Parapedobacter composti TaxID=623281 RepID=A0A1I1IGI7_9SPHI|nr:SRPBCC family protein [Parapedobacter composti]SFC35414.1 Uncharacterized membrane protein [Parapedobacter composti]
MIKNVGITERLLSVAAGAFLLGKTWRRSKGRPIPLLAGGYLIVRGSLGYCPLSHWIGKKNIHNPAINIKVVMTVSKPREMVYQYWRTLRNLPSFMAHLQEVEEKDEKHSRWVAKVPGTDGIIEWEAEIVKDEPQRLIGWQSTDGAIIRNAGKVQFFDAPKQGTEVRVIFSYHPPAGGVGVGIAKLLNPLFKGVIEDEIRNFKRVIEAGEIPTTVGQPAGVRTGKFKLI